MKLRLFALTALACLLQKAHAINLHNGPHDDAPSHFDLAQSQGQICACGDDDDDDDDKKEDDEKEGKGMLDNFCDTCIKYCADALIGKDSDKTPSNPLKAMQDMCSKTIEDVKNKGAEMMYKGRKALKKSVPKTCLNNMWNKVVPQNEPTINGKPLRKPKAKNGWSFGKAEGSILPIK
mmetsp:Transcript_765/g.1151  ORF Transcript_765/g.1151 Transcript_765/m.1151 type:complete len:178 (+) Transcript_765:22-555(+)